MDDFHRIHENSKLSITISCGATKTTRPEEGGGRREEGKKI